MKGNPANGRTNLIRMKIFFQAESTARATSSRLETIPGRFFCLQCEPSRIPFRSEEQA